MKTIFVLLFCLIVIPSSAHYPIKRIITPYFWGGLGAAMIRGNDSWKDPVGIQLGVETPLLAFNENTTVNTGLNVSLQGAGWEEPVFEMDGRVRLTYLNVPVLLNYQSSGGIYAEIGLQPGFLLSARDKYNGTTEDYKYGVKNFDLGLPLGVGYKLNDQIAFGIRATYGITNLDATGSEVSDHNLLIVGLIRYVFELPD